MKLYTPSHIANIYSITEKRVREIAISRKVGQKIGKRGGWVFLEGDIEKLKPGKPGRPKKQR